MMICIGNKGVGAQWEREEGKEDGRDGVCVYDDD